MMTETVGQILKKQREEKNLSLDQATRITHIRKVYLEALENNQADVLPSAVHARGFLRLYADYLGLSAQVLLDIWDGKTVDQSLPETEPVLVVEEQADQQTLSTDNLHQFEVELPPEPDIAIETNDENTLFETQSNFTENSIIQTEDHFSESEKIFKEIGKDLKTRRESLGITYAEAEKFTRLKQAYLNALEEGRLRDLPSPVQGRGMLNNYASFLEMDSENVMLRFAEGLQTRRMEHMSKEETSQKSLFPRRRPTVHKAKGWRAFLTPDLIIGGSIILVIIFFAIWTVAQVSATRSRSIQSTAPAFAELLQSSPTNFLTQEVSATVTPTLSSSEDDPVAALENPDTPLTDANNEETTATVPAGSNAPIQVYVVARQRAWLQIKSDQKEVFNGRVVPGNAYPFNAEKTLELNSGNAAALQVFYNQRDLGTLGIDGQVVRLIFDDAGITTPTPAASLTPTATLQPTLTPIPTATSITPTVTPFIP